VGAAILLAVALLYGLHHRLSARSKLPADPGPNSAGVSAALTPAPIPSAAHPAPLRGGITLWVNEPGSRFRRGLRLHQPGAVPVKSGDEVRIEAGVNRPAYLYLFWIGSDGKVAPLYPWKDHDWTRRPDHEDKVEGIELPEVITDTWELPPSAPGLETLVLLAREESPLPRDADSALQRGLVGPPMSRLPDGMTEAVWLENGQEFGLDERGKERAAPGPKARTTDDPVLRIRELLRNRLSGRGEYHRAVIVPNLGGPSAPGPISP
jgi:hypothetical protein